MKQIILHIQPALIGCLLFFLPVAVRGQITVQIGTGNNAPSNGTQYSPMYRFSAASATTNSRSNILFTQDELVAAGIPAGATIIGIQFNKLSANNFLIPASFSMFMNNSNNTSLDAAALSWTNMQNTFTTVYANTSFNMPAAVGWVSWDLQTPFVYTGGALEIATENTMTGGATGASGNLAWEYTNTTPAGRIVGSLNQTAFTTGQSVYLLRPNIKISYYPPQTTVQIGAGNDAPTNSTQFSPIYRFSAASAATSSRSDILFTQAELTAAGIPAGATITAVQFNKLNANNFLIPSNFSMLMNNSANTVLDPAVITWPGILANFSQVYTNASFNLPATAGWVEWKLMNSFVYTGGALEIATDNTMTGGVTGATGNFAWEWTNTVPISQAVGNTNGGAFSAGQSVYRYRPNIKITYYAPACARPNALVVNNITNITAHAAWDVVAGATGYQYAVTTNPNPPASGTDVTANNVDLAGLNPVTQYYLHVRTNCGTGYSLFWATIPFNTLEACPRPAVPVIMASKTDGTALVSWQPSPFGAVGYEYAVTNNAVPPTAGAATTSTNFTALNLTGAVKYYVHVRANCNAQGYSPWVTKDFVMPCFIPAPVISANSKAGMVNISWRSAAGTRRFEYAVTHTAAFPASGIPTEDTVYQAAVPAGGGKFYFQVRSLCGSSVSPWATLTFNTVGLTVYPNPVRTSFNLVLHGVSNTNGRITISDAKGRTVGKLTSQNTSTPVNASAWPSGLYIIRYDDAKNSFSVKVMKQ